MSKRMAALLLGLTGGTMIPVELVAVAHVTRELVIACGLKCTRRVEVS